MTDAPRTAGVNLTAHPQGGWNLGVVGKRTYTVVHGRCVASDEQLALVEAPVWDDEGVVLLHDTDMVLNRTRVDVIVQGHAHGPPLATRFESRVAIGTFARALAVVGNRRVYRDTAGVLRFTSAGVVDTAGPVPLDWTAAYGGVDRGSLALHGDPMMQDLARSQGEPYDPRFGLHAYPRNPVGRGYVTEPTPEGLEACALPNLEEPAQVLTPETLCVNEFLRWPMAPLVASTGWLSWAWFPRGTMMGLGPHPYDPDLCPPERFPEVLLGISRAESITAGVPAPQRQDMAVAQGSAVGMRAAAVRPGESVECVHMHPRMATWRFTLPEDPPRMVVQLPDGPPEELMPAVRTVLLEPEKDRVVMVWTAERRVREPLGPGAMPLVRHAVRWTR